MTRQPRTVYRVTAGRHVRHYTDDYYAQHYAAALRLRRVLAPVTVEPVPATPGMVFPRIAP